MMLEGREGGCRARVNAWRARVWGYRVFHDDYERQFFLVSF